MREDQKPETVPDTIILHRGEFWGSGQGGFGGNFGGFGGGTGEGLK